MCADLAYKTESLVLQSKGLLARYVSDRLPDPHFFNDNTNLESRLENSLSTRLGITPITVAGSPLNNSPLADTNIHTLSRLKSLASVGIFNYAGAGANLYRKSGDGTGAYSKINSVSQVLSGSRFSSQPYTPLGVANPYLYVADASAMLKDNGLLTNPYLWGIDAPRIPPTTAVAGANAVVIDGFDDVIGDYTFGGSFSAESSQTLVNTTLSAGVTGGSIQTVGVASFTGITQGMNLLIDTGGSQESVYVIEASSTTSTIRAYFANAHSSGAAVVDNYVQASLTASSPTSGYVQRTYSADLSTVNGVPMSPNDLFIFWLYAPSAATATICNILFDVGDGSFTNYYEVGIDFNTPLAGKFNINLVNGWNQIAIPRSYFGAFGTAGTGSTTWATVAAWRIWLSNGYGSGQTFGIDDFYLSGGNGPDITGGTTYDYRYTYVNADLTEGNPSVPQVSVNYVSPVSQPVLVTFTPSTDPQVQYVNIYRRGGTLAANWTWIAQVANSAGTYVDSLPDSAIATGKLLSLVNDPPVTSNLPQPVNTTLAAAVTDGSTQTVNVTSSANMFAGQTLTVDVGTGQELVIIQSVGVNQITAYFQVAHASGAILTAATKPRQAVNLCALWQNQIYLAGDPNNPHFLYYSNPGNPEGFSPTNYVEVGTPSDPIMAVVAFRGSLFCFTLSTVFQILQTIGPDGITLVPYPIPTGSRHGMAYSFAWTLTENAIVYLSHDGVYAFGGGASAYESEPVEWLFTGQTYSPVPPLDSSNPSPLMAFYDNEIYLAYTDNTSVRRRIIYSLTYKRWRPDDVPALAMYQATDISEFLISEANGMIYQDRVGDVDVTGYVAGVAIEQAIPFSLITQYTDIGLPKMDKNFNEVTVDMDAGGEVVTVTGLFDFGATSVPFGTLTNTGGRSQLQINVNNGNGQLSRVIALKLTGSVTSVMTFYQVDFRAVVDAEPRKSLDTYYLKFGRSGFTICKQMWVTYLAEDAAGVTANVYLEGQAIPKFSFTLPQSTVRTSVRVRFPAYKARIWRFVFTSDSNFKVWNDSLIETKSASSAGGYALEKLQEPS